MTVFNRPNGVSVFPTKSLKEKKHSDFSFRMCFASTQHPHSFTLNIPKAFWHANRKQQIIRLETQELATSKPTIAGSRLLQKQCYSLFSLAEEQGTLYILHLTSWTGGASGFLNSESDTGRENLESIDGRLCPRNWQENASAKGE